MEDRHTELDMENVELRKRLQQEATKTTKPKTTKFTAASPPNSEKFTVDDNDDCMR